MKKKYLQASLSGTSHCSPCNTLSLPPASPCNKYRCTSQVDQAEEQNGSGFLSFSCSNKLNKLRHEILSITLIRKYIYLCIMFQEFYLFVIMTIYLFSYNMQVCVMTYDALPLGFLICHPCECYIHTPIACSPYTQSSVNSIRKCKQSQYNQPKPYVFKKIL